MRLSIRGFLVLALLVASSVGAYAFTCPSGYYADYANDRCLKTPYCSDGTYSTSVNKCRVTTTTTDTVAGTYTGDLKILFNYTGYDLATGESTLCNYKLQEYGLSIPTGSYQRLNADNEENCTVTDISPKISYNGSVLQKPYYITGQFTSINRMACSNSCPSGYSASSGCMCSKTTTSTTYKTAYCSYGGTLNTSIDKCVVAPTYSACSLPWGGTINHGSSTTAYRDPVAQSCTQQTRFL